jgi:hypothetical protein
MVVENSEAIEAKIDVVKSGSLGTVSWRRRKSVHGLDQGSNQEPQ